MRAVMVLAALGAGAGGVLAQDGVGLAAYGARRPEAARQEEEAGRELEAPARIERRERFHLAVGPQAGYMRARQADRGEWFGGVQLRTWLLEFLGAEGAVTFHSEEFADDTITVTRFPVQLSAILSPLPGWDFRPYAIGGVGWYYTRVDFDEDAIPGADDDTDNVFGVHVGGGVEVDMMEGFALQADVRYIWLDDADVEGAADGLGDRDFDTWQVTGGLTLGF